MRGWSRILDGWDRSNAIIGGVVLKVGDRFILSIGLRSDIKVIYFINSERDMIDYCDANFPFSSYSCSFDFFKEYAIILTPLTEELL